MIEHLYVKDHGTGQWRIFNLDGNLRWYGAPFKSSKEAVEFAKASWPCIVEVKLMKGNKTMAKEEKTKINNLYCDGRNARPYHCDLCGDCFEPCDHWFTELVEKYPKPKEVKE